MIEGEFEHPLATPTRRYVKEAQLQEVTKGTTRKHSVVIFLFNDLLVVTKPQGSSFLSRNKAPRLLLNNSFELAGSQVIAIDDTPGFPNAFIFIRKKSRRSLTLLAGSKEAKDEWVAAIEAEINDATQHSEAQDMRVTNSAVDKVDELKLKLEQRMTTMVDAHKALTSSSDEDLSLSSTSSSSISTSGDDLVSPRKSMTLKEKRIALMNQARKNSSGSALTSVAISADNAP